MHCHIFQCRNRQKRRLATVGRKICCVYLMGCGCTYFKNYLLRGIYAVLIRGICCNNTFRILKFCLIFLFLSIINFSLCIHNTWIIILFSFRLSVENFFFCFVVFTTYYYLMYCSILCPVPCWPRLG